MTSNLEESLKGADSIIFAVRHNHYMDLDPDEIVKMTGGPVAVIDCFGVLDDAKIERYFELGCDQNRTIF